MSRFARPATQAPGWPEYVPPWRNGAAPSAQNGARTVPETTTALSGTYPEVMPFAQVIRSGVKP